MRKDIYPIVPKKTDRYLQHGYRSPQIIKKRKMKIFRFFLSHTFVIRFINRLVKGKQASLLHPSVAIFPETILKVIQTEHISISKIYEEKTCT